MKNLVVLALAFAGALSMASGWECVDDNKVYTVKLYNKTGNNSRTPATLVVAHRNLRTLLVARGSQIIRRYTQDGTNYTAWSPAGDDNRLDGSVKFFVHYRESEGALDAGTRRRGKLTVNWGSSREVTGLNCKRTLKN